ncbi:hypothetical protein [Streptomyces sp. CoH17]|uniref:hypothetical protein n=1 Tax=Streptomyces sp. CoH17 TaxID=2992806 RepID=UPI00226DC923|nr:hypothetical protein [Streptomyces sp. CoH17]
MGRPERGAGLESPLSSEDFAKSVARAFARSTTYSSAADWTLSATGVPVAVHWRSARQQLL